MQQFGAGETESGSNGAGSTGRVLWEANGAYDWAPFSITAAPSSDGSGGAVGEGGAGVGEDGTSAFVCQGVRLEWAARVWCTARMQLTVYSMPDVQRSVVHQARCTVC